MGKSADRVDLKPQTLLAFTTYITDAEGAMEPALRGDAPFLWMDGSPERARQVREGATVAGLWSGDRPVKVPDGLIHDWVGAVFVPRSTLAAALNLVQDYDHHKDVFRPEVIGSRLLAREGDHFQIYLRLLKKKIMTVVLDTDHDVHYFSHGPTRSSCRSQTIRVAEVENAGKPGEKVHPPDTGYGFLWRLNSYWRFEERDGGVYIECRAVSLTRDVPKGLGWIIEPIIQKLPKESLKNTLEASRRALATPEVQISAREA